MLASPAPTGSRTWRLRFDGGSRGNPGVAGGGAVLYAAGERGVVHAEATVFCGRSATNNAAEYAGCIRGLELAGDAVAPGDELAVEGDSKLVLSQLAGAWQVKESSLMAPWSRARELAKGLAERGVSVSLCHIARALNSHADRLANEAMDTMQSTTTYAAGYAEGREEGDDEEPPAKRKKVTVVDLD